MSASYSLLPNAEQQFFDSNGNPLSGGKVFFYVPGTTMPKATYADAAGTIPNTNPVILDSAGRAIIFGGGQYRQIVHDAADNLIWDQTSLSDSTNAAALAAQAEASAAAAVAAANNTVNVLSVNTGRNRLLNGWMEIQQRGMGPFTANGGYTADRWQALVIGGTLNGYVAPATFGKTRFVLGASQSVAIGGVVTFYQSIEATDAFDLASQLVNISFYANATTSAGTFRAQVSLEFPNAYDNWSSKSIIGTQDVPVTSFPSRVSAAFNLPPNVTAGLRVVLSCFQQDSVGTLTFNISGVQLEMGGSASQLEKRQILRELELCQRFYQTATGVASFYSAASGTHSFLTIPLPVYMRSTPTLTVSPSGGSGWSSVSPSGGTSSAAVVLDAVSNTTGQAGYNYSFTASAEL